MPKQVTLQSIEFEALTPGDSNAKISAMRYGPLVRFNRNGGEVFSVDIHNLMAVLSRLVEPTFANCKPLILYFATDKDVDEFMEALKEVKPNLKAKTL